MADFLKDELEKINIELSVTQEEQLNLFHKILVEWNGFMNLTGITEYEEVVIKHYMDSLAVNCVHDFVPGESIIDVGTGAGFPGIPLKIVYPECEFTLLDSLNKRINFLNEVIKKNSLEKITTLHGRAEDYARTEHRESYDVCVSRAVANMSTLCEYCLPYVKVGGVFISYKSGTVDDELQAAEHAISMLGGKVEKIQKLTLPDTDIERTFVVVRKDKPTGKKYPRKSGLPSREPLK